jgi:ribA/ribD-fused uncharacterized protein
MRTFKPALQQKLGKKVKKFESAKWDTVAQDVVYKGNFAKFTQHEGSCLFWYEVSSPSDLKNQLLSTGKKVLVEASPMDDRWGIGLGPTDLHVSSTKDWRGYNWLGIVIMRVRKDLYESQ